MRILLATLLLALSGFAQPSLRQSIVYLTAQTGTIGNKQVPAAIEAYQGCAFVGVTPITDDSANVWCINVEVLY